MTVANPAAIDLPNLAHQVRFRTGKAYCVPKFCPKGVIVNLAGHIQTPTVDPLLDPVFGDIENVLTYGRVIRVEFRQALKAPPGGVIGGFTPGKCLQRKTLYVKPVVIG